MSKILELKQDEEVCPLELLRIAYTLMDKCGRHSRLKVTIIDDKVVLESKEEEG